VSQSTLSTSTLATTHSRPVEGPDYLSDVGLSARVSVQQGAGPVEIVALHVACVGIDPGVGDATAGLTIVRVPEKGSPVVLGVLGVERSSYHAALEAWSRRLRPADGPTGGEG
jgi:hypothetical protein